MVMARPSWQSRATTQSACDLEIAVHNGFTYPLLIVVRTVTSGNAVMCRNDAMFSEERCSRLSIIGDQGVMGSKLLLSAATVAVAAAAILPMGVAAQAQDHQAELIGFHQLCNQGDRKACIRFGIMLGENKERHIEWRKTHPEFWWWER
jgi:hypothetical protein